LFRTRSKEEKAKKLSLRLSRASFEEEKTVGGFDFTFNPKVNHKFIQEI
jgi:DNA replication protein DnaC